MKKIRDSKFDSDIAKKCKAFINRFTVSALVATITFNSNRITTLAQPSNQLMQESIGQEGQESVTYDDIKDYKYVRYNFTDDTFSYTNEIDCTSPYVKFYLNVPNVDISQINDNYTGPAPYGYRIPLNNTKQIPNYGNPLNDEHMNERVNEIYDAFNEVNQRNNGLVIYDNDTNQAYTKEKIRDILTFEGGAKGVADTALGVEAYHDWLDFTGIITTDPYFVEQIMFATGDESLAENVKEHDNIMESLDLGHSFTGDYSNGPLGLHLGDNLKDMASATTVEEGIEKYNDFFLAVAAATEGNGFIVNGNYCKIDQLRVNELPLVSQVLIAETLYYSGNSIAGFAFYKENNEPVFVETQKVIEEFNMVCKEDMIKRMEDNNLPVPAYPNGQAQDPHNRASVFQQNVISNAVGIGEFGLSGYYHSYQDYAKYFEEQLKQNGTVINTLESDYAYGLTTTNSQTNGRRR